MDADRAAIYGTVAVVVAVALASSPLVGAVDLTPEHTADTETADAPLGSGSADVSVASVPDAARFVRGDYGASAYSLRVPNAALSVASVAGRPFVTYKLRIDGLGYATLTLYELRGRSGDEIALTFDPQPLAPDRIDRERYTGELLVTLADDRGRRVLYRGDVAVEVVR
ncbi:hypothetical protein BRC90_07270 [Halobacteriales archaeon QS_4_69_34]|nr:MAG: hypothetical protein BRC90_07270 [Halobacteriales archaeon QS_4_69_34]